MNGAMYKFMPEILSVSRQRHPGVLYGLVSFCLREDSCEWQNPFNSEVRECSDDLVMKNYRQRFPNDDTISAWRK